MTKNLDTLKEEIPVYAEEKGLALFRAAHFPLDARDTVIWDTQHHPDFRPFIDVAVKLEVKVLVYQTRDFEAEMVDDALARLETSELPREEARVFGRRLRELRAYEGFTCLIELFFDKEAQSFLYGLRTDWYNEFLDILDEIDVSEPDVDDEEDQSGPMGEYFSRN
jgi:hypothetical protein